MSHEQLFRHPAIQILQKALVRELRMKAFVSIGALSVGILLLWFSFQVSSLWSIIALLFLILGISFLSAILYLWSIDQIPLLQILKKSPQQVVWIYTVITQRMPFGFEIQQSGLIYFKLENKDEISVSLAAKDLKLVSKTLNRLLPNASFGYSKEKEEVYEKNPSQLLKQY